MPADAAVPALPAPRRRNAGRRARANSSLGARACSRRGADLRARPQGQPRDVSSRCPSARVRRVPRRHLLQGDEVRAAGRSSSPLRRYARADARCWRSFATEGNPQPEISSCGRKARAAEESPVRHYVNHRGGRTVSAPPAISDHCVCCVLQLCTTRPDWPSSGRLGGCDRHRQALAVQRGGNIPRHDRLRRLILMLGEYRRPCIGPRMRVSVCNARIAQK